MRPEQLAASVLGCEASALSSERIKRGLTNESWRVRGAGHDVIVRISTADEHALQLDRISEAYVLKLIEAAGIGPSVLKCEPTERLLITRTLPGCDWAAAQARELHNISRLAHMMRRLHVLPVPSKIQAISLTSSLRAYWAELEAHGTVPAMEQGRRARALQIAEESDGRPLRCLCHTDLHHFNIIDNGERLWIIDWEYAGIGDAYFDLASVCCWHEYDEALRHRLLTDYFGEATERRMAQLDRMCWLFDYIKELWFAVRAA